MKNLDELFDRAKEDEIIPLTEIKQMLSSQPQRSPTRSFNSLVLSRRKGLTLATLGIFATVVASIIGLQLTGDNTYREQEIFIPQSQRRVMHLVQNISARPNNGTISVSQFGRGTSSKQTVIPVHLRSRFELSEDKLKLLGITFTDELIKYEGNVQGSGYVSFSVLKTVSTSVSVDDRQYAGVKEYEFYPWFLTDETGFQSVRYRFDNEPSVKMTNSFFYSVIDQLIPIQVSRPGFKKVIFWFSQTPELMRILESAAMMSENTETSDDPSTEERKRTTKINIFPTITKGEVQVEVNVLKKQKLEIVLLEASGEVLQVAVSAALEEGDYNFSIDLSSFKEGLYFVRIKSAPGLTTIHRLFKE